MIQTCTVCSEKISVSQEELKEYFRVGESKNSEISFALNGYHYDCALSEYQKVQEDFFYPGKIMGVTGFDDDSSYYASGYLVLSVDEKEIKILKFNTSYRHERKGGEKFIINNYSPVEIFIYWPKMSDLTDDLKKEIQNEVRKNIQIELTNVVSDFVSEQVKLPLVRDSYDYDESSIDAYKENVQEYLLILDSLQVQL